MVSLEEGSQNVELKQNAAANNPDVLTSSVDEDTVSESGGNNKGKTHGFSKTVAEFKIGENQKIGWAGAVILRFLSSLQRTNGLRIDGKPWLRINLDNIAAQYPYLDRSSVDKAIGRLIKAGACETKNLNREFGRPKYDRTRCYHIPKSWMDLAETDLRYFDSMLAAEIGVPAAVIFFNFMHWRGELRRDEREPVFEMAPATLVTLQPFARETIKRALKTLVEKEMIYPVLGKRCHFTDVPSFSKSSKVDEVSSKVDMGSSKVDKVSSKVDNDSIGSLIVVSLKENSKSQAALASDHSASHVEKNNGSSASPTEVDTDNAAHIPSKLPVVLSPFVQLVPAPKSALPIISTFEELHHINKLLAPRVDEAESENGFKDRFITTASNISDRFLRTLDQKSLDELFDYGTDEEIHDALFPLYQAWFVNVGVQQDSSLFAILYYGIFEVVTGAFNRQRHNEELLHPFMPLRRVSYRIYLTLYSRAEDRREKAVAEEFAQRRADFKSIDEHLEEEPELPPAQKARVFKQGLNAMNRVGWICLGGELRTDGIIITSNAMKRVEMLFEQSLLLTAGDLLRVMNACVALHEHNPPAPTQFRKGCRWHARMAHHLPIFVRYLGPILRQLKMDLPTLDYLDEEEEYDLEEAA